MEINKVDHTIMLQSIYDIRYLLTITVTFIMDRYLDSFARFAVGVQLTPFLEGKNIY